MTPADTIKLLALLERIAVALESGAAKAGSAPGGGWRGVEIAFGKKKGTKLGDLDPMSLEWWAQNYQPRPFGEKQTISARDKAFRAALDAAAKEMGIKIEASEQPQGQQDEAPAPAAGGSTPVDDSDVPF